MIHPAKLVNKLIINIKAKNISFNTPVIGSVPLHKCKWCGVEVTTPDDNCYLNPN